MARGPRFQMTRSTRGSAARKIFDMKHIFSKLAVIVLATSGVAAFAAPNPATATFQVKITVQKSCSVTAGSASDINFGTHDASAIDLQATNNISVTCSKRTPYTIALVPSNANTAGAGVMTSLVITPVDTVNYQLRQATGLTATVWGSVVGTNTVAGMGTGAAVSTPVFATVPSANSAPADYVDTVTINVAC